MRTGKIGLNKYLFDIGRAESPYCQHCLDNYARHSIQTVRHIVLECPGFSDLRALFPANTNRTSLEELLNCPQTAKLITKHILTSGLLGQFRMVEAVGLENDWGLFTWSTTRHSEWVANHWQRRLTKIDVFASLNRRGTHSWAWVLPNMILTNAPAHSGLPHCSASARSCFLGDLILARIRIRTYGVCECLTSRLSLILVSGLDSKRFWAERATRR